MVFMTLDSLDKVNALVKVCERYKEVDTDVMHGRYTVDGRSVLGVSSLLGNIVKVCPNTTNKSIMNLIVKDLTEIGAWEQINEQTN